MQARGLNAHRAGVVRWRGCRLVCSKRRRLGPFTLAIHPPPTPTRTQVDAVASKAAIWIPGTYDAFSYAGYKVSPCLPFFFSSTVCFLIVSSTNLTSRPHQRPRPPTITTQAEHEQAVKEHHAHATKHAAGAEPAASAASAPTN